MQSVPWQVKIAAKIVLARLPLPYHFWEKIGPFKQGGMGRPEYALRIFRRHFDAASLTGKADGFVGLELGPGDSLDSALIAKTFGASKTFLVDVESCASTDLGVYRRMESHLRLLGMYPPNLDHCRTIDDVAESCGAEYLTEGLDLAKEDPVGVRGFCLVECGSSLRAAQPVRCHLAGTAARSAPGRSSFARRTDQGHYRGQAE